MGAASAARLRPSDRAAESVAWRPNPGPQTLLLTCPLPDVFYGGARGGGKSAGLLMDFAAHAQEHGKAAGGLLFRQSYPEFEELEKQAEEFYAPLGWAHKASERAWEAPNGARLRLRYLETAKDAAKHQGESNTWIGCDEAGNYPDHKPIDLMVGTLRSKHGVPCYSRLTGNPGGVGHLWLKRRYVQAAEPGTPFELETGRQGVFIPAVLEDNPYLIGTDYERNIKAATFGNEALWKAWRYGDWEVVAGAAFHEWNPRVHVVPDRDTFPPSWGYFAGLDWGYAKGAAVLNAGCAERLECFDAVELVRMTAKDAGGFLATRWKDVRDRIKWIAYSPDMDTDTGLAKTLTADFLEGWAAVAGRAPAMLAGVQKPGSREAKFALMHQALAWTDERLPDGRLAPWAEPYLVVQKRATYLRETIPVLPLEDGNPNDIDTDADDHGYDAQGFVIAVRQPPTKAPKVRPRPPENRSNVAWAGGGKLVVEEREPQRPAVTVPRWTLKKVRGKPQTSLEGV